MGDKSPRNNTKSKKQKAGKKMAVAASKIKVPDVQSKSGQ